MCRNFSIECKKNEVFDSYLPLKCSFSAHFNAIETHWSSMIWKILSVFLDFDGANICLYLPIKQIIIQGFCCLFVSESFCHMQFISLLLMEQELSFTTEVRQINVSIDYHNSFILLRFLAFYVLYTNLYFLLLLVFIA